MSFQVHSNCPSGLFLVVPGQVISVFYRIIPFICLRKTSSVFAVRIDAVLEGFSRVP
jgi:hypothetical protein